MQQATTVRNIFIPVDLKKLLPSGKKGKLSRKKKIKETIAVSIAL